MFRVPFLGMCELIVGEPDLDWTIIRFIAPNDKPKTGEWKIGSREPA
jgi:hypothetical protein